MLFVFLITFGVILFLALELLGINMPYLVRYPVVLVAIVLYILVSSIIGSKRRKKNH